jgi:hypothetical protein
MGDKDVPLTAHTLTAEELALTPVRELLTLAGELFAALLGVPAEFTDEDLARGRVLRLALAEVADRAQRIFPAAYFSRLAPELAQSADSMPPGEWVCSCGEAFESLDELDEHFFVVFVPADDMGLDGKPHVELVNRRRGSAVSRA